MRQTLASQELSPAGETTRTHLLKMLAEGNDGIDWKDTGIPHGI